jgi:hypothetical protein
MLILVVKHSAGSNKSRSSALEAATAEQEYTSAVAASKTRIEQLSNIVLLLLLPDGYSCSESSSLNKNSDMIST